MSKDRFHSLTAKILKNIFDINVKYIFSVRDKKSLNSIAVCLMENFLKIFNKLSNLCWDDLKPHTPLEDRNCNMITQRTITG